LAEREKQVLQTAAVIGTRRLYAEMGAAAQVERLLEEH
jgi:hypothetical protein